MSGLLREKLLSLTHFSAALLIARFSELTIKYGYMVFSWSVGPLVSIHRAERKHAKRTPITGRVRLALYMLATLFNGYENSTIKT